jgi:hypothetical protein
VETRGTIVNQRLFDVKHAAFARRTAQQVLWPLKNQIPPQMGNAHYIHDRGQSKFRAAAAPDCYG